MWKRLAVRTAVVAMVGAALCLTPAPAGASPGLAADPAIASSPNVTAAATYTNSRCGNTSGRVLLTFDDWAYGDPYRATRIGGNLRAKGIRAAFFLINEHASKYPDIVATLRQQGHWVANHTWSHPNLTTLSDSSMRWQISNGVTSNRLRPPGGAYDSRVSSIASGLGYRICMWTIDTLDWQYVDGARRSAMSIRARINGASWSAKSSGGILGHLSTKYPDALPGIISDLHGQGLLFCHNRGPVGVNMPFPLTCT
ncbi:polysaccharide deacetylase family protein [Lysobacter korlensis]|uniref:Polysaccharide deacetylase family protein n=1 Tax=Lysobacter korlensis TaxID=553636 RepID=A0ABV6RW04_9GAMM